MQCQLINAEVLEGYGGQWIPTKSYPYSGLEFSQLTDVEEAVKAYCFELERAGVVALDERIQNGKNWFEYLSGTPHVYTAHTAHTYAINKKVLTYLYDDAQTFLRKENDNGKIIKR